VEHVIPTRLLCHGVAFSKRPGPALWHSPQRQRLPRRGQASAPERAATSGPSNGSTTIARSSACGESIAKALSAQDSADVAAYFAAKAGGLPALSGDRVPESGRSLRDRDRRSAWHLPAIHNAPSGHAPPVTARAVSNLECLRSRASKAPISNDNSTPSPKALARMTFIVRCETVANQPTPDEMHSVAVLYGTRASPLSAKELVSDDR
jgi:hypothetical protein